MSDRLHRIDPDPRRGCDPGCGACAQLEADFASIRRESLVFRVPAGRLEQLSDEPPANLRALVMCERGRVGVS